MKNILVLTGVPGSGKTTILNKALESVDFDVKFVNFAEVMLSTTGEKDHDAIRKQDLKSQITQQEKAAEVISSMEEDFIVVDTHCFIRTPAGYLPGLPSLVLENLKPNCIVTVEATPEELLGRRQGDKSRKRDEESVERINLHQDLNRSVAISYCAISGATLKIIINHDNKLEDAAKELADLLNSLRGE